MGAGIRRRGEEGEGARGNRRIYRAFGVVKGQGYQPTRLPPCVVGVAVCMEEAAVTTGRDGQWRVEEVVRVLVLVR
jgi:hypothetical protein